MKKSIRRAIGLLLMLSSGYLISSTLLSLVPLIRTAKAPLWLTLAVALAFLALFAALFYGGWRLFREKKPPEPEQPEGEEEMRE